MYEKQTAKIIPFRSIDIFENAVSAGTGNFLVDEPKETVCIDESILPEDTTFGVRISGDSMEPEFHDGQIAWVLQQESSLSRLMKSMHLSRLENFFYIA